MKLLVPQIVSDANFVSSSINENDHATIVNGQAYAVGARVIYQHQIYEALTATITNWVPPTAPTEWLLVGPTNRWAMFDESVGTASSGASPLTVTVQVDGAVNDVVLLNVVGTSVSIALPGITRNATVPAAGPEGSTVIVSDIASLGGPRNLTITLTGTGTVSIGSVAIGAFTTLGDEVYGTALGMIDYSTKEFDKYGVPDLVVRDFSREIRAQVDLPIANFDLVCDTLSAVRSQAVVWTGVTGVQSMVMYGLFRDFELTEKDAATATLSIQLESLAQGDVGV